MTPATLERELEHAVSDSAARESLRNVVISAIQEGAPRDEVYAELDQLRLDFRRAERTREEGLVMDVMELFHQIGRQELWI